MAVLGLSLFGCASSAAPGPGAGPTSPSSSPPPTGSSPAPTGSIRVLPVSGSIGVSGDGLTLSAHVEWSGCQQEPTLVLAESSSRILASLRVVDTARVGMMCPDIARTGTATARLADPLGTRPIVDATTNQTVPHTAPGEALPSMP